MSKSIRYKGGRKEGVREHVIPRKFDSRKQAAQVSHEYVERHTYPVILRTGTRGK